MFLNHKFYLKLSIFFFITSSLLVVLYSFIDSAIFNKQLNDLVYSNIQNKIVEREKFTNLTLDSSKKILYSLRKNQIFINYLSKKPSSKKHAEYLLENIISSHPSIMQIRYIDEQGDEQIRYDRVKNKTAVYLKRKDLQNKFSRYYFQNSITKDEKVYFSSFDLNIDKGEIEKPFNPTYRAILPVRENGVFRGILIINYFGDYLTDQLFEMPLYDAILIDSDGYIIKHYDKTKDWSRYQDKSFTIDTKFNNVLLNEIYYSESFVSKKLNLPFINQLYLILQIDHTYIENQEALYTDRANFVFSVLIASMFILSIIIYLVFNHLEKQNLSIQILTKEMKEQDRLLIQSSKMAAMGEMIANIAHQWKQPLSVISLHIINFQRKHRRDQLDENFINNFIEKVSGSLDHMSSTVEDFSNFFKPTKEKEDFCIHEIIDESLELLHKSLKDNNITVNYNKNHNLTIFGYKNEFKQVVLNILSNSKDAIKTNDITNAQINIKISHNNSQILITFKDNGGGIPKEIIDRVFEPYFTTKFKKDGTGIGLYMCKMIIEDHFKGTIKLENKDDGTLCTIELPKE